MSAETELLNLAEERFGTLSPADIKLFRAVAKGEIADYSSGDEREDKQVEAGKWGADRTIAADRIEWLGTDRKAVLLINQKGIGVKGAKVDGEVHLDEAIMPFCLYFENVIFNHDIDLTDGEIRSLYLIGCRTQGIIADNIRVRNAILLRDGFRAEGEVRLPGAEVGGNLDCGEGEFVNTGGCALNADGIRVKGDIYLREGFRAHGEVRLLGADIGGDLDCSRGLFESTDGDAICAHNAGIGGNLIMRDTFDARGMVSLAFARVGGALQYLDVMNPPEVVLDLRSVKVGTLYDSENAWPAEGNLLIDGFEYEIIADKATKDAGKRLDWLRRQADDQFRPQPYEQLAKVLEKSGFEGEARKIRIAKNKDRLRLEKLPWYEEIWLRLLGISIAYGYRPLQAIPWITGFILLGLIVFGAGYSAGVFTPLSPTAYVTDPVTGNQLISSDYPKFHALAYSFNEFIPLINLRQGSYWTPNPNKSGMFHLSKDLKLPVSGLILRDYLWVHTIAGWVFTSLLVAGLAGLVKK